MGRIALRLGQAALVVWGARDPFAGVEFAHRFHEEIPGSELVVFDDAGHFVWEDAPAQATGALIRFLKQLDA